MFGHGWRVTLAALGAGCLLSTAAPAATIGFDGLTVGAPFTGDTRDGFTVAPVSGVWSVNGYGAPGPSLVSVDERGGGGQTSGVAVTRGRASTRTMLGGISSAVDITCRCSQSTRDKRDMLAGSAGRMYQRRILP